ncbi:Dyp-type peroxidase [Azoarcus sp. DN11]|uniref:Dyp-type peroxidase n=1 Tax=Azoarcus sp. DN11 TaxID=356837 RepID=UPI000EB50F77|nr:Dyp-type peroxidase [Azoarcus sp. DN11]AYH44074.1 peroxidase [Azoarcus sp. DN11]
MTPYQPGIMKAVPPLARHLFFTLDAADGLHDALDRLARFADGDTTVVGLGESLVRAAGGRVDGLRAFPVLGGSAVDIPSTQHALWCWLRGEDRGELLHRSRHIEAAVAPALRLVLATDAFRYGKGLDLTGYEDGTENPEGDEAVAVAFASTGPKECRGGSFAAVQHWQHDLDHFDRLPANEQDHIIGRRKGDNEELEDAPESAHVKRTAQESFDPEAFVLRRSMPWSDGARAGLAFLAFGRSFDAFEAQLRRLAGLDDGIVDALFRFSHPTSGGYYWCPPMSDGRIALRVPKG